MTDTLVDRVEALRGEAVGHVTQACMLAWPQIESRFGRRGRETCAEDIDFHLDFLLPAVAADRLSLFTTYLGWLSQVLESRGVPVDSIPYSLQVLQEFFTSRLGGEGAPIVDMLAAAGRAMEAGIPAPVYDRPCPDPWAETDDFREALLAGNQGKATAVFRGALERSSALHESEVHVIQPAMYEIGRLWQENKVSVAQEHLASAIAQTLMARGYSLMDPANRFDRLASFACTAGNQHVIGLRMVADAFEYAGWNVQFLGANTPQAALIQHVRTQKPDLLGLSVSLPFQLRGARDSIAALRAECAPDCPRIAVGGLVFNQFPQLAEAIGAEMLGTDSVGSMQSMAAA